MAKGKRKNGRRKGVGNLTRIDGGFVNQYKIPFTDEEKKALENAVRKANRKRAKMLEEEAALPRKYAGVESGEDNKGLQLMGRESDFILARKTASIQRFKSKEEFYRYMDNLDRVNSPGYIEDRIRAYKRNYTQALYNAYGDEAKDVAMKIRIMKPADYMKMVQSDEGLEIGYIYDPSAAAGKLNQIRASLGMKLKEDYIEMDDYDY